MNRLICCQCFLVVMMTTCSTATEKDNNNLLKGETWEDIKANGLLSYAVAQASDNIENYEDTVGPCMRLVLRSDIYRPANQVKTWRFVRQMFLVMNCIVVADVLMAPINVVKDARKALSSLEWKDSSIHQKMDQVASVPAAVLRSIALLPFQTLVRLMAAYTNAIFYLAASVAPH